MVTVVVGSFWGAGPACITILLSLLGLYYFVVPPTDRIDFYSWPDLIFFGSFIFAQLAVLVLLVLREKDRHRLFLAEQEARRHAQELAESNEQLAQADRLKDYFLSQASHELKTPITAIHGLAQYALRRLRKQGNTDVPPTSFSPQLEKIEAQTDHLASLVYDLLDISSLTTGKLPLRLSVGDLVQICRDVIEDQCALSGRRIDLTPSPTALLLKIDRERISQVASNLITNAIKYSPVDTSILVSLFQQQNALLLVHNDGPTIPQEQQRSLFEPFYRTPDARSSSKEGWGLGLAISKQIIERHKGQIWVESSEGKGTTFYVELPLDLC
jgi:signal transduction histidine kinase